MKTKLLKLPPLLITLAVSGCAGTMPELGVNAGKLSPCPDSPNCVSSQSDSQEHQIAPLRYSDTKPEAHARLLAIVESEKRTHILTAEENYIRAEFTSAVFRFVDDVEFYFPEKQAEGSVIHMRSASRLGHSDFGVNRKRIERIRGRFSQ